MQNIRMAYMQIGICKEVRFVKRYTEHDCGHEVT